MWWDQTVANEVFLHKSWLSNKKTSFGTQLRVDELREHAVRVGVYEALDAQNLARHCLAEPPRPSSR